MNWVYKIICVLFMVQTWSHPLFNQEEKKEVQFLMSKEFLRETLLKEMAMQNRIRPDFMAKLYLEEAVKTERIKRKTFLEDNLWEKWEKMEDFNALHRWLQSISPIVNSKTNTKDKL